MNLPVPGPADGPQFSKPAYRSVRQRRQATRKVVAERAAGVVIREFAAGVVATLERQLRTGRRRAEGCRSQLKACWLDPLAVE
jgi:hypothetical protein